MKIINKIKERLKTVNYELQFIFLNYIVCNIPVWLVRMAIYRLMGMQIGIGSRILMKTKIIKPAGISIGQRTIVNENCYLDGRGKLMIRDDTSISFGTKIITGSHDINSKDFRYITFPVEIGNKVFIGADSIILGGGILEDFVVIAAGSVTKKERYISGGIYSGVPAQFIKMREMKSDYQLVWKPWFL